MPLHVPTPLLESLPLSRRLGRTVRLKMDALQPTGSFKARGIGYACEIRRRDGARRFVSSSGGNAGLAVAAAGRRLGVPVLVVVPATTTARARAMIELEGATVLVHGESWVDAHAHALGLLRAEDAMIHPFDDPLLWTGHSTLVDELAAAGPVPDAIVLSVGGGGLLGGVLEGLDRHGWSRVGVVAAETAGADSFAQAHAAGRPVTLPGITSIATSLGARTVSATVLERARTHRVEPVVVTDRQAVEACLALADEHRVIVEPACGAALAALTAPSAVLADAREVVVIVCGGVAATLAQLETWSRTLPSPG